MAMVNKTKKQVNYKQQAIGAINTNSNFRHMKTHVHNNVNFFCKTWCQIIDCYEYILSKFII
jgi:hypothetical protein